ncbi:unnamed protein product, partial [Nesidiocoris tenuis]
MASFEISIVSFLTFLISTPSKVVKIQLNLVKNWRTKIWKYCVLSSHHRFQYRLFISRSQNPSPTTGGTDRRDGLGSINRPTRRLLLQQPTPSAS